MKLYQLAFTHKSYLKRILQNRNLDVHIDREPGTLELQDDSNERLEFLGDQITNSIIVYFLYRTYPTEQEGFLTKLKTNLISTQFYAKFARYLGLQRFLVVSKHVEEQCNGRNNDKILENVFESFMGALFEDFSTIPSVYTQKLGLISGPGYEICEKLVVHLLQKLIDFDDIVANDTNYKDILLRYYQATFQIVPKYVEICSSGPPNNRIFTMGVYDKDNKLIHFASIPNAMTSQMCYEALKNTDSAYFKCESRFRRKTKNRCTFVINSKVLLTKIGVFFIS
jgi:dsRNA-specific ribonuclease